MDGLVGGWVTVGLQREIMEKEKAKDNYFSHKTESRNQPRGSPLSQLERFTWHQSRQRQEHREPDES